MPVKKKEAENEAEAKKMQKKPVTEEDGKLVKEAESEAESEAEKAKKEDEAESMHKEAEEEDDSDLSEEEKVQWKALKAKVKRKMVKGEGSSLAPQESEARSATSEGTITPNLSTPSQGQNVFVPPSGIHVARTQETPMSTVNVTKSFEPDVTKSPLFMGINKQLDSIQDSLSKKIDAVEKSVTDRLKNVKSDMEKIEKFYTQSFYKAIDENVSPEGTIQESISKQMEKGKLRFTG